MAAADGRPPPRRAAGAVLRWLGPVFVLAVVGLILTRRRISRHHPWTADRHLRPRPSARRVRTELPSFGPAHCHPPEEPPTPQTVACVVHGACWTAALPGRLFASPGASDHLGQLVGQRPADSAQPLRWPLMVTSNVSALQALVDGHSPMVQISGTLFLPSESGDELASLLPLVHILSHSERFRVRGPFLIHHAPGRPSSPSHHRLWLPTLLHFLGRHFTQEGVIEEPIEMLEGPGDTPSPPAAPVAPPAVSCVDWVVVSPRRGYVHPADSLAVRRAVYSALRLSPIAFGATRREALLNAQRLGPKSAAYRVAPTTAPGPVGGPPGSAAAAVVVLQGAAAERITNVEEVLATITNVTGVVPKLLTAVPRGLRAAARALAAARVLVAPAGPALAAALVLPVGAVVLALLPHGRPAVGEAGALAASSGVTLLSQGAGSLAGPGEGLPERCTDLWLRAQQSGHGCADAPDCIACAAGGGTAADVPQLRGTLAMAMAQTHFLACRDDGHILVQP